MNKLRIDRYTCLCVRCGAQFRHQGDSVPQAPAGWRGMDQAELAVWYARNVIKVMWPDG
ncbi:MAG: hypothetical protein GTO15_11030 [Pseudomonas stutzeri]|nr:hypothetical protein [Stutzerimonas stutzeri]